MISPDENVCQPSECAQSSSTSVGTAVGVMILITSATVVVAAVVVATIIFLLCWLRYVRCWLLFAQLSFTDVLSTERKDNLRKLTFLCQETWHMVK